MTSPPTTARRAHCRPLGAARGPQWGKGASEAENRPEARKSKGALHIGYR